jgi:hypothetical protein
MNRKFEIEFYQPEGQDIYRVIFTDVNSNHKMAINSIHADLDDTKQRRHALDALFGVNPPPFSQVVRQRLFPSDTRIYDEVDGIGGKKLMNPRYPEENPCQHKH